jgi:GTPase
MATLTNACRIIPIFLVSSVTGENIQLLTRFMNVLPKPLRNIEKLLESPMEFQVEEVYSVPGI